MMVPMRRFLWLAVSFSLGAGCDSSSTGPSDEVAMEPDPPVAMPDPTARYRVTFDATWSAATHPDRAPDDPHFSPLVGATHDETVSFWREGEVASDGIEAMAERGRTTPLDQIVQAAIDAGTAESFLRGEGIDLSPGSVSLELTVSTGYPLVTLVSMIAPSPDWFVGIASVDFLEAGGGDWPDAIVFELPPYDAGTDSGGIYTARDRDTQPREPIRRISGAPFAVNGMVPPLGTFTFTRLE